jgi:glycerol-3-phosphate dehydrogenase (NAD(P)+)
MTYQTIAVLGAGAWGCALANAAVRAGRAAVLWARDPTAAENIARTRRNPRLPGVIIDPGIDITSSLAHVIAADALMIAVPAQALRTAMKAIAPILRPGTAVVACAKGIERGTHKFVTEVIAECAPAAAPAILSGPSFAADVARGLPTAVTLAAADEQTAAALAAALGSATFRPYHTSDVRGVEIGGAAKNVLAIAAGIVHGRGLGASAAAALITRGFAELFRLGKSFGARPDTLVGLSGLGDLVLTCSSPQSRNFSHGIALGRGASTPPGTPLVEGVFTAPVLVELARERNVVMPIAEAVAAILDNRVSIDDAIEGLLTRPFRAES